MSFEITKDSVLAELSRHIGAERGLKVQDMVAQILWRAPTPNECRQFRHIVESLRNEGQHICGTPATGYFIASNEAELNQTCELLYKRAMTSLVQVSKMKKASIPDLRGQLGLKI